VFLRMLLYCALCGLFLSWGGHNGGGHLMGWWWLQGMVLTAGVFPIVHFGPANFLRRLAAVWMVLVLVSGFSTWLEGRVYLPLADWNQSHALIADLLLYTILAVVIAGVAGLFELVAEIGPAPETRDADGIVLVMLAGGIVYLICHWVFGAIFFRYSTHSFYSSVLELKVGIEGASSLGARLHLIEFGRGALMALAVVPAIAIMRVTRMKAAILAGSVLWIAGGLALQIAPNPIIPQHLRWLYTWQILLQNFPVGFVTAWIMRKTGEPAVEELQEQAASTTA
jgi:hypothetical protein